MAQTEVGSAPIATDTNIHDVIAEWYKHDQERYQICFSLMKQNQRLNEEICRLGMDLRDQTDSRVRNQKKADSLADSIRGLKEQMESNQYVIVLVDGDGAKFLDEFLQDPVSGAAKASECLRTEVQKYLQNESMRIIVRVFCNLSGLAKALCKSNVIRSEDDMCNFATRFTDSRGEFDFVDVGPGKENTDHKIRTMLDFHLKNYQCSRIFLAGCCHDNGYTHNLKEIEGSEDRVILVKTTPAEPAFVRLGLPLTSFDTVFRSQPLNNETRRTIVRQASLSQSPAASMSCSAGPVARAVTITPKPSSPKQSGVVPPFLSSATESVTISNNGGTSVNYSTTYARVGGMRHKNVTLNTATQTKPKVSINRHGWRLDQPIKRPKDESAFRAYDELLCKASGRFCNDFYFRGDCKAGVACNKDHTTKFGPKVMDVYRYKVRTSPCPKGSVCEDADCYLSHQCPYGADCKYPVCKFSNVKGQDLHLIEKQDMIAVLSVK